MNPARLLDDIVSILNRYGPLIVLHAIFAAWLIARVLSDTVVVSWEAAWASVTAEVDSVAPKFGLTAGHQYVLAVLAIGYVVLFQWTASLLSSLPLLRLRYVVRHKERVVAEAGRELRLKPDYWEISSTLSSMIDTSAKDIEESGRNRHPFRWTLEHSTSWNRYYEGLLVLTVIAYAWSLEGGTLSRSVARVWELAFALTAICFAVRWKLKRNFNHRQEMLAHFALQEFRRQGTHLRSDHLAAWRIRLLDEEVATWRRMQHNPGYIITSFAGRFPDSVLEWALARFTSPYWKPGRDWDIFASSFGRHPSSTESPPAALSIEAFASRFVALLECQGSGLNMLVPNSLALAPSLTNGGSSFDFAERRHSGHTFSVHLNARDDLSSGSFHAVPGEPEMRTFIIDVGHHPIEKLAQRQFPGGGRDWHRLVPPFLGDPFAGKPDEWKTEKEWQYCGFHLSRRAEMKFGSSYLMGARTMHGTEATVAFQCFRVLDAPKLLLAWRILGVWKPDQVSIPILPWWRMEAWRRSIRKQTKHFG